MHGHMCMQVTLCVWRDDTSAAAGFVWLSQAGDCGTRVRCIWFLKCHVLCSLD